MIARIMRLTCVLALVSATGASAPAAGPVATTQPKVKFRVMETPYTLLENAVDPLVKETSKYVAIVRADDRGLGAYLSDLSVRLPEFVDKTPREVLADDVVRAFLKTQLGHAIILRRVEPLGRGVPRGARPSSMGPMTGSVPVRPPSAYAGTSSSAMRYRIGQEGPLVYGFVILAPTAERAKELARALITVYNHGWAYPERRMYLKAAEEQRARLPKLRAQLKEAKASLAKAEAEMDRYEKIGQDGMASLRKEKWIVEVRLAGVRARLKAAAKLEPDRRRLPPEAANRLKERMEGIRIVAEVELAGLLASKARIDELIKSGAKYEQLRRGDHRAAVGLVNARGKELKRCETAIAEYREQAKRVAFHLVDEAIPVQPIKWTQPRRPPGMSPRGMGGAGSFARPGIAPRGSGRTPPRPGGRSRAPATR